MSRLDDAIAALRTAAGDRSWILVIDRRGDEATDVAVCVATKNNLPPYTAEGLLRLGVRFVNTRFPIVETNDEDEDDPD